MGLLTLKNISKNTIVANTATEKLKYENIEL